jgi:hypothetical protein
MILTILPALVPILDALPALAIEEDYPSPPEPDII